LTEFLPGLTHYNVFLASRLAEMVESFLDGEPRRPRWGEQATAQ
jgi:hypothetical protein